MEISKEEKADDMFRKLGFYIDEDENRTIYSNRDENIIFDNEIQTVITGEKFSTFITMFMLQSINKKVEELGWN